MDEARELILKFNEGLEIARLRQRQIIQCNGKSFMDVPGAVRDLSVSYLFKLPRVLSHICTGGYGSKHLSNLQCSPDCYRLATTSGPVWWGRWTLSLDSFRGAGRAWCVWCETGEHSKSPSLFPMPASMTWYFHRRRSPQSTSLHRMNHSRQRQVASHFRNEGMATAAPCLPTIT